MARPSRRAASWSDGLVLVAVSGWGQDADKCRSTEAGFDRHLVKPVDPRVLTSLLGELCA